MKYSSLLIASMLLASMQIEAQSYSDALRFNSNNIEGTARSQAMGSAFGALGADLSSAPINPAGLASYRAMEFGFTTGLSFNNSEAKYYGNKEEDEKVNVPFNQMGIALNLSDDEGWQNFTFFFGYTRLADYNFKYSFRDCGGSNSLLDYYTTNYDWLVCDYDEGAGYMFEAFDDGEHGELDCYHNIWECPFVDADGNVVLDSDMRNDANGGLIDKSRTVKGRGNKGEITFAVAASVSSQLQLGASFGIQTLDYKERVRHSEEYFGTPLDGAENYFNYGYDLKQDGVGVNLKLGVIYKPINALRIGFALHTPTFFNFKEKYDRFITDAYDCYRTISDYSDVEYNYKAPGMFVASVAGVVGRYGIVSFDYERTNYGHSKFYPKRDYDYYSDFDEDDYYDAITDDAKYYYKQMNTFRLGFEGRLNENFSLRLGYKYSSSPLKSHSFVADDMKNCSLSAGVGYRFSNFFFDLAFVQQKTQQEYFVLPDGEYLYESNEPALVKSTNNKAMFTLGWRF